jgi:hypothetical protein
MDRITQHFKNFQEKLHNDDEALHYNKIGRRFVILKLKPQDILLELNNNTSDTDTDLEL